MARNNQRRCARHLEVISSVSLPLPRSSHGPFRRRGHGIARLVALGLAASLCGSNPASASLRVVGEGPRAALWQRLYDALPAPWKTERTLLVQELTDAEMAAFLARVGGNGSADRAESDSTVDGCYQKSGRTKGEVGTIRLCRRLEGAQAELVFAHEYGHFIWDQKLVKAQRARYKTLWRQQKRAGHLVTKYAGEDVEEGFAEAVAYFLRQPATLQERDPESYRFFSDLPGIEKAVAETKPCSRP